MRHVLAVSALMTIALAALQMGCREDKPTAGDTASADDARKPPQFSQKPSGGTVDMNKLMAEATQRGQAELPAGHPPIGTTMPSGDDAAGLPPGHPPIGTRPAGPISPGAALPANHPPIGGANAGPMAFSGDMAEPAQKLDMAPPATWQSKPARPMTVAVYTLPRPEGGREDAELTISHYPGMKNIPLQMQVDRWAGQLGQKGDAVAQTKLENASHPTTLVDISGSFQGGGMMGGPAAPAKPDYRMVVAVLETEQGPWFFRLVGPKETVAAHEQDFLKFARDAK